MAATRLLLAACDEGIDAVRYSPAARAIVDDLQERPPPCDPRRRASADDQARARPGLARQARLYPFSRG